MRLNLASGRHTKAEDEDDRGMRVILLCAGTSGAAHKVHSDVRVDLPSAGDTRADNTDHRRMSVDRPYTADSGAAHKVHRRMRVDLRGTGETGAEDRVRLRVRLNLLFAARSGAQQRRSGVAEGGRQAFRGNRRWKSGGEIRVEDRRRGCHILVV
jgi:hypothetical protein